MPGYVDVIGSANSNANVMVKGNWGALINWYGMASRKGEYFRAESTVDNGSSGAWLSLTSIAALPGGPNPDIQSNVVGNVYVPKTPEAFVYDLDGNLTSDGRWNYTWDAENRLVKMAVNTPIGPQLSLQFEYDSKGRRIRKQVWQNTTWTGTPSTDLRFVYDGWNLLASLNPQLSALNNFMWGLDLSGSVQGAGGVGGLLSEWDSSSINNQPSAHFAAFDGNGNVAALVNAGDGTLSAQCEYGPFGEVIRSTGPMAKANPFRFSTKYQDGETDLVYYPPGRYYIPSTGRWASRDPMEEEGGLNLYAFVDNDAVDAIDMLGFWRVERKIQFSRATVTAEADGESIADLAAKVGLEPGEYHKWLKPVGGADFDDVHCGDKFTIPNEVVVVVGKVGFWPRPKKILDRMAWRGVLTMGTKGFKVYYKNRNVQTFTADDVSKYVTEDLWGYALFGHGRVVLFGAQYGGDFLVTKNSGDYLSAENMQNKFRYGLGITYFCSAPFENWRGITSYNGVFWGTTWWMQWVGFNQAEVQEAFQKASQK